MTFIDFSAAFDTVSHKFLDTALSEAKASRKVSAMFRAVYSAATAYTTVPAPDGKRVKSESFEIKRGVVQDDITSPLYVILALELIMKNYDTNPNKGVSFAGIMLHTLGYADDVALIDYGDEDGILRASERVTCISRARS